MRSHHRRRNLLLAAVLTFGMIFVAFALEASFLHTLIFFAWGVFVGIALENEPGQRAPTAPQ